MVPILDVVRLRRRMYHRKKIVHYTFFIQMREDADVVRFLMINGTVIVNNKSRQISSGGLAALPSISFLRPKQRRNNRST